MAEESSRVFSRKDVNYIIFLLKMIIRDRSFRNDFSEFLYGNDNDDMFPLCKLIIMLVGCVSASVSMVLLWDNSFDYNTAIIPFGITLFMAMVLAGLRAYEEFTKFSFEEKDEEKEFLFYLMIFLLILGCILRAALILLSFAVTGIVLGFLFLLGRRILFDR